ncbi:hypothetical protein BRC97_08995 [Halobacteriales archaeon QS_6_71_20]|nr:MAG: hypothetical protein BRC97_08995 [Halobacteriales archaeon QS_6_71_20]
MSTATVEKLYDRLGMLFFPLSIGGLLLVLLGLWLSGPLRYVIFGLYPVLGLAVGAAIYYSLSEDSASDTAERIEPSTGEPLYGAGVYATVAITLAAVSLTGRPLAVGVGLGVGYVLVLAQLVADPTPERVVPQLVALFLLSPATKYLTAGRYIGHGDLMIHVRIIEDLLVGNSLGAISYTSYQYYPGTHLLATTVSSLSGLGAYDGMMLVGLVVYALLIPTVYLIAHRITGNRSLALSVAFAAVVLDDLSFYASYVFPQAIATVLVLLLVLLAGMVSRDAIKRPVAAAFAVVTVALSVTHHFTQVLFLPVLGVGCVVYVAHGREKLVSLFTSRQLTLFVFAAAVNLLWLRRTGFFDRLSSKAALLWRSGPSGGYTSGLSRGFGRMPRSASTEAAFEWLASPYALYLIVLLVVFSVGVVTFLRWRSRPATTAAVVWTGILGAVLVFETPLSIKSLIRIRFPWQFVFAFVIGIGILRIRRVLGAPDGRRSVFALLFVIVVVLAASAPLVTADNYYGLDPRPTAQSSIPDQEYAELESAASFVGATDEPTTTLFMTRLVLERFGPTDLRHANVRGGDIVLPAGYFVYRSSWPDYKVNFEIEREGTLYGNSLYVSSGWLSDRAGAGNKVYTAGGTGVLWSPRERPFDHRANESGTG